MFFAWMFFLSIILQFPWVIPLDSLLDTLLDIFTYLTLDFASSVKINKLKKNTSQVSKGGRDTTTAVGRGACSTTAHRATGSFVRTYRTIEWCRLAPIAQWSEHRSYEPDVRSSNLRGGRGC